MESGIIVNNIITASSVSSYMTCPQRYNLSYNHMLSPTGIVPAFATGGMVHAGLESYWKGGSFQDALRDMAEYRADLGRVGREEFDWWQSPEGDVEIARCVAYLAGYYEKWRQADKDEYDVISVEKEFLFTDPDVPGISFAGKMDVVLKRKSDGAIVVMDHKTAGAGSGAGEPGSPYWLKLPFDNQVNIYLRAAKQLYGHDDVIFAYDVILKTGSKPQGSRARIRKGEDPVSFEMRKRETSESVGEYAARIRDNYTTQSERYVRREIMTLDGEAEDKWSDLTHLIPLMTKPPYVRNTVACSRGQQTCPFMQRCLAGDATALKTKPRAHMELSLPNTRETGGLL